MMISEIKSEKCKICDSGIQRDEKQYSIEGIITWDEYDQLYDEYLYCCKEHFKKAFFEFDIREFTDKRYHIYIMYDGKTFEIGNAKDFMKFRRKIKKREFTEKNIEGLIQN